MPFGLAKSPPTLNMDLVGQPLGFSFSLQTPISARERCFANDRIASPMGYPQNSMVYNMPDTNNENLAGPIYTPVGLSQATPITFFPTAPKPGSQSAANQSPPT